MKIFQTLSFSLFLFLTAIIAAPVMRAVEKAAQEEALAPFLLEAKNKAHAELDKIGITVKEEGQKKLFVFSGFENLTAKSIVIKREQWGWLGMLSLPNLYIEFFITPHFISVSNEVEVKIKELRSAPTFTASSSFQSFWSHTIEIDSFKVEARDSRSLTLSADMIPESKVKNLNEELLIP